jgi:hypothetical protein
VPRAAKWEIQVDTVRGGDRSYDIDFWQRAGAQARFDAAWDLVVEAHLLRGADPNELRLQRSVVSVERASR